MRVAPIRLNLRSWNTPGRCGRIRRSWWSSPDGDSESRSRSSGLRVRIRRRQASQCRPWAGRPTDIRIECSAVYTLRCLFIARITSRDNKRFASHADLSGHGRLGLLRRVGPGEKELLQWSRARACCQWLGPGLHMLPLRLRSHIACWRLRIRVGRTRNLNFLENLSYSFGNLTWKLPSRLGLPWASRC